jgi:hypothetical protein
MRLIRFVAVACMVAVSVASLGCGGAEAPAKKDAETPAAETSSTSATTDAETATAGTTPVSLAITGMA